MKNIFLAWNGVVYYRDLWNLIPLRLRLWSLNGHHKFLYQESFYWHQIINKHCGVSNSSETSDTKIKDWDKKSLQKRFYCEASHIWMASPFPTQNWWHYFLFKQPRFSRRIYEVIGYGWCCLEIVILFSVPCNSQQHKRSC